MVGRSARRLGPLADAFLAGVPEGNAQPPDALAERGRGRGGGGGIIYVAPRRRGPLATLSKAYSGPRLRGGDGLFSSFLGTLSHHRPFPALNAPLLLRHPPPTPPTLQR